jgi:hypothetical protein
MKKQARKPRPSSPIIVAEAFEHWNAWFEDRPMHTFGGDTPGTAVERLWDAELNNREASLLKR